MNDRNEPESNIKPARLISLDALRGFDMFWITGGQKIIFALASITGWPIFNWLNVQMHHVPWNGFAFYDIIFALFLFLAGVSMPFSFAKRMAHGESKLSLYKHSFLRMLVLIILGLIYNHFLDFDFENIRFGSVLGRIGIAWFLAVVIYLNASVRWQIIWFWSLLIVYCMLMLLVPVPGFGANILTPEGNLAGYIDRLLLPGKFYLESMEPEGILSTIPAVGTALLGTFAGSFLRNENSSLNKLKKGLWILIAGSICVLLGGLWGIFFPINKNLWSSSFVLFAGGLSLILLAIFYLVIDVWGFKKWSFFFIVIGMNPITIYMAQNKIINFNSMRDFLFSGIINISPDPIQPLINALAYVACVWGFLYFLYRKKIFVKV